MKNLPVRGEPLARKTSFAIAAILLAWFLAALAAGASGKLRSLHPPQPQLVVLALTAVTLLSANISRAARAWCASIDIRWFVALHVTRFVGFYFLWLAHRHELAPGFAVPAGIGDIFVATLAVILLSQVSPDGPKSRRAYLAWNIFGFIDIAFVVLSAARLGLRDPASMQALLELPLCLLPMFLVPLIIATHVMLFKILYKIQ